MKTIDGQTLKLLLISGANNLYNHYPEIDALNVFPVPDGDTGMNMNLTVTSGSKEIANRGDESAYKIALAFSKGLLMGARGNSGVITSQIFRGFAQGIENLNTINVVDFSNAFQKGVEVAYKAVINPVEGTILTVIRESSEYLHSIVKESMSIEKALDEMIKEGKASLKRTPDLLPILKEVGVVDSGGAGLISILEGMREACDGNIIERNEATAVDKENPLNSINKIDNDDEFGYCTEFIMKLETNSSKKPFSEVRFTKVLNSKGNSLVVVKDDDIVKVHVHTMQPGDILNYAQQFGEFIKLKIENMTEQHNALISSEENHSNSAFGKTNTKERTKNALIAVSYGEGIDSFFKEIGVDIIVKGGQTMNPSSEDFVKAINDANADNVFIFPNNSNIFMAANQAKDMVDGNNCNVFVIPSKTIPQGLSSSMMFDHDLTPEENISNLNDAISNVKSGEVTFSIRDSEMNGIKIKKDDFIGIYEKNLVVDNSNKVNTAIELLDKMIDDDSSIITLLVGEDVSDNEKATVVDYLTKKYSDIDLDVRDGKQPVYSFLIGIE